MTLLERRRAVLCIRKSKTEGELIAFCELDLLAAFLDAINQAKDGGLARRSELRPIGRIQVHHLLIYNVCLSFTLRNRSRANDTGALNGGKDLGLMIRGRHHHRDQLPLVWSEKRLIDLRRSKGN